MKRKISRAAAAAGSLALLGGALVAGAAPALAAPPPATRSWGAAASGTITLAPVALAMPASSPVVASNANIAGLLATTTITDRASAGGAWARVNGGIVLTLPNNGSLTTSGLRSWCTFTVGDGDHDGDDVVGGATIFSGAITVHYLPSDHHPSDLTIPLPQKPAPNTVITLPDSAGTITLNDQTITGEVATFEAIKAVLSGQTVDLGVSQCGADT